MSVMTVLGPISADALGITLPHEHLFLDLRNQFTEPKDPEKQRLSREKLTLANSGVVRRNPYAIKDNLLLDELEVGIREAACFRSLGGNTIVDCTSIGIQREPERLKILSERTGLHVVAGCGYYTHDTHPSGMDEWSAEQIAGEMVRDMTVGIGRTGIKAGVIGEIGTSDPIHPREEKNLRAAALAFKQTSAAVYVHTFPWGRTGLTAARLLTDRGVNPAKIVICHVDVEIDTGYIRELLDTGALVEFDNFGKEFYIDPADRIGFATGEFARDIERIRAIKQLLEWGYEQQILITNDICLKAMLREYGGWGYGHILEHVLPMMVHEGIPERVSDVLMRQNPKRLLDT